MKHVQYEITFSFLFLLSNDFTLRLIKRCLGSQKIYRLPIVYYKNSKNGDFEEHLKSYKKDEGWTRPFLTSDTESSGDDIRESGSMVDTNECPVKKFLIYFIWKVSEEMETGYPRPLVFHSIFDSSSKTFCNFPGGFMILHSNMNLNYFNYRRWLILVYSTTTVSVTTLKFLNPSLNT